MTLDATFGLLCGDNWAHKQVSHNDSDKGGLYVTREMQQVMLVAGFEPVDHSLNRLITFDLINGPRSQGRLSYYLSQRGGRTEPRMGQQMVSQWLEEGDLFFIGFTGDRLIAAKESRSMTESEVEDAAASALERFSDPDTLREAARRAPRRPSRRAGTVNQYARSPAVVAYVRSRAAEACEMPDCRNMLFCRADGFVYLEVHHVTPLAEGGDDSIDNAAALCPTCHRAQHHAVDRERLREILRREVQRKNANIERH